MAVSRLLERVKKEANATFGRDLVTLVHMGSSAHPDAQFVSLSDVDIMVVTRMKTRKKLRVEADEREVQVVVRSKRKFLSLLRNGNPLELSTVRYGRVIYGDREMIEDMRNRFGPTEHTWKVWLATSSRRYAFALAVYAFPGCACCFVNDLYHAARESMKARVLKENGVMIERLEEIMDWCRKYGLEDNYERLLKIRGDWEGLSDEKRVYENVSKRLEAVRIASRVFGPCYERLTGMRVPGINELLVLGRRLGAKWPEFMLDFDDGIFTGGRVPIHHGKRTIIVSFDRELKRVDGTTHTQL